MGNRLRFAWPLAVALLIPAAARAQYANHSLGVSLGALDLAGTSGSNLSWGAPVGLCGTLYLENRIEAVAQVGFIVAHDTQSSQNVAVLDGPSVGIRYLFSEEWVRPFVGVDLSYLHIFGTTLTTVDFVGLGPNAGVDFFVSDTVSVGLRARFNLYVFLNPPVWTSLGATAVVATHF